MKCKDCLSFQVIKKGLTKVNSVTYAITLANDAVTVVDGNALCVEHFAEWIKQ